jgi:hypothetical protein
MFITLTQETVLIHTSRGNRNQFCIHLFNTNRVLGALVFADNITFVLRQSSGH